MEHRQTPEPAWRVFERQVASTFRAWGAEVQRDVSVAGNQIDVLVKEKTASGQSLTTVVECKAQIRPVGVERVNALAGLFELLRSRQLADAAMLVSRSGFTRQAREAAEAHGVELRELEDLLVRPGGLALAVTPEAIENAKEAVEEEKRRREYKAQPRRIFVAMPFAQEFNDVYLLGIREVAERLGFTVERADEIEHGDSIVDVIIDRIKTCQVLIADTTDSNPNVFYEIGYGNALDVPTVLICKEGNSIPFDLRSRNHIIYGSIVGLRQRLEKRLQAMMRPSTGDGSRSITGRWSMWDWRHEKKQSDRAETFTEDAELLQVGTDVRGTFTSRRRRYWLAGVIQYGVIFTGTWGEDSDGVAWHGAFQFRIGADGETMSGRWVGASRDLSRVNCGEWEWKRSGVELFPSQESESLSDHGDR